ncbi:MAG: hypothetical protein FD156_2645 [Nitrospirae bacterium]|nr:MAG: hypothetical protein FD156_2645 [Nitrospirota bacterium]
MPKLKIYTDENVDVRVSEGLRLRGIKAVSAIEKGLIGISDIKHFSYASEMQATIFSHDHHFIEIAKELTRDGKTHWGVIFVEMNKLTIGECIKRLSLYAEVLSAEDMKNQVEFL